MTEDNLTSRSHRETTLLVAEDVELVRIQIVDTLQEAGYSVIEAEDGEQAVLAARVAQPDLAILDIEMPGMTGLEAGDKIRRLGIPFIVLTGYDHPKYVEQANAKGCFGYAVKYTKEGSFIDLKGLVPTIETALARANDMTRMAELLEGNNVDSLAIGFLMGRFGLPRSEARALIRDQARSMRRPFTELAKGVIEDAEQSARSMGDNLRLLLDSVCRPLFSKRTKR